MANQECQEFVGKWKYIQTLGEGAYGEVKLLMHQELGEKVAVKIVDLKKHKDAAECVRKEVKIHGFLKHESIIKLYGNRREVDVGIEYIFLEYASGGELFNRIEPDVGMPYCEAQKYMRQLLSGVNYLHQNGITHRDIKPENLLLDAADNLKISDFGMATVFRFKGKERLLDKRCGTLPYIAPEIFRNPYYAQPADIWSCGIVLITMVTGELPWNKPIPTCTEFVQWTTEEYLFKTPWCKLDNTLLNLARKILSPQPQNRPLISQLLSHPWMLKHFACTDQTDKSRNSCCNLYNSSSDRNVHEMSIIALSQPTSYNTSPSVENLSELLKGRNHVYFSQPTQSDKLLINSQMQATQHKMDFQHLIKRMTRFFVKTTYEKTIQVMQSLFDNLHYSWSIDEIGFTICTVDSIKMQLVFKANIIKMNRKLLLDFRLSRGCGLEFKRKFMKLKNCLSDIILQDCT